MLERGDEMADFKERVAIVTGGARGIGMAISRELASKSAVVAVCDLLDEEGKAFVRELNDSGGKALFFRMDVSSHESVDKTVSEILEKFGKIDFLVNNAGIARDDMSVRMNHETWEKVVSINLTGAFNCKRAVLRPMMKQRFGRIVNITSVVASTGNPGQANYVAAKAGLIGMTKAIALEMAKRNITVNSVAPGFIDTDMTRALPEKVRESLKDRIPMGRLGTPGDVADAVLFLLSDRASYITGQTIHVNGGMFLA